MFLSQASVIRVDLRKPLEGGLGFTLVKAEKAGSSALFVRQISVDGVAHADGRLKVGDKLLQVRDASEVVKRVNEEVT